MVLDVTRQALRYSRVLADVGAVNRSTAMPSFLRLQRSRGWPRREPRRLRDLPEILATDLHVPSVKAGCARNDRRTRRLCTLGHRSPDGEADNNNNADERRGDVAHPLLDAVFRVG